MSRYTDDLRDEEWEIIKGMFPKQKTGRLVTHELRKMLNVVFYIVRTWCSWRNLPKDFPNWQAVYTRFRRWKATRLLDKIYKLLTYRLRKLLNKEESSVGIIDSQSVKITDRGGEHGYDEVKKVNGRKRHIVVDNLGYPIEIRVTKADIGDRQVLLELTESLSLKVKKICRYGGYQGERLAKHLQVHGVELSIVKRPRKWCGVKANEEAPALPKFSLLPKLWLVERTFAWLGKFRRLSKDYEFDIKSSIAMIVLALIRNLIKRITKSLL